jgi:hypothetical protein
MRAWICSSLVLLLACGGSTDTIDGGDDSGTGNDGTVVDTGPGNDGGTTDAADDTTVITDGGNDGTTVEAGPFDPSQLGTDLVLWLEGDKGVTEDTNNAGHVQTWADQTSYHNDASGVSGNYSHEPTINATALNNLPAVEFSGGYNPSQYLTIADSASLEFGAGDFAIFFVAQYSNPITGNGAGQATFYNKVAGNTTPTGPQLYGNAFVNNAYDSNVRARLNINDNVNSSGNGYNDGNYHRFGIRRNGSALEVWADGTSTAFTPDAGANVDVSATGSDVFIGATVGGNYVSLRLVGGIAEVVGVKGTLSDADTASLDGYFTSKYGL